MLSILIENNPLDVIEIDGIRQAIIELRRLRRCVCRHATRNVEIPAILKKSRDAGTAKAVIADRRFNAGTLRPALHHLQGIVAGKRPSRKLLVLAINRAEYMILWIASIAASLEIFREIGFEIVMARYGVLFAAFFVELDPQPAILGVDITKGDPDRSRNPGEGVDHQTDQRAIAQPGDFAAI